MEMWKTPAAQFLAHDLRQVEATKGTEHLLQALRCHGLLGEASFHMEKTTITTFWPLAVKACQSHITNWKDPPYSTFFLLGQLTIAMAMFNSYNKLPEGNQELSN